LIPFLKDEIEGTIGQRLRNVASQVPDTIAVKTAEAAFTYAELDAASDSIAQTILLRRGPEEEPVAMLFHEGIQCMAALFGILKAGKSAVLLSPDFQPSRLTAIWEDAQRPLVLVNRSTRDRARAFLPSPDTILDLDESHPQTAVLSVLRTGPEALAVIAYTSGSTGEPKGVMWSHRFVLHTCQYNSERYRFSEADRFVCISAYGFGAALIQSFAALLNGATLYLRADSCNEFTALVEWLRRERITIVHFTSFGILRQQTGTPTVRADLVDLRIVLLSGEELYRQDFERFRSFFPKSMEYSYRFAGSEALMICEARILPETEIKGEKVPAGCIVPDKELLLLDSAGRIVSPGEPGEIAVRSRYLADGYWRQAELTRAKFLPDPEGGERRIFLSGDMGQLLPDGQLLYLGRKDNIVRVRGFNIQLEAVEAALQKLPGILEAAAMAHGARGAEKRLVAYLVPGSAAKPSVGEIRRQLVRWLPAYMIPTIFVFLDALPRTPMERLDRRALPPPGRERPNLDTPMVEPGDDLERRLCALWRDLLGLDQVGVEDDFFLLGGDSLLSVNMALQVEETFHREIPSAFFGNPTIANLARLWRTEAAPSPREHPLEAEPSLIQTASAPTAGSKRSTPRKKIQARGRYQSRTTAVGPYSLSRPKRIARVAVESLPLSLPYSLGCRWLSAWCRRSLVVRNFYPAETALFRRWVDSLGGCPNAPAEALSINLIGNILWSRRFKRSIPYGHAESFLDAMKHASAFFFRDLAKILETAPLEKLNRFFSVDGLEYVDAALRENRGVILVTYHGVANRFSVAALPRLLSGRTIPTLGLSQAVRLSREKNLPPNRINEAAVLANMAIEGHRLLKQGGILQVIPDIGYDASDGLPLAIGGYRFLIKPGFAELAILADAAVIPFYTTRRIDGSIYSRVFPPFARPSGDPDRKNRVYDLLSQYAEFVDRAWKTAPESLLWQVIDTHLNRPPETS
jgi:amino acid adenylation domain-containing protein